MDIILFGIQGSGKGTQGKILAEKFGLEIFETGAELRRLSEQNSPLAQKVKSIIEAGHLVPNEVVMEIVENFMNNRAANSKNKGILFDGIPRKKEQARSLKKVMEKHKRKFIGVHITLSEEDAMKRLTTRRICEKCKITYPENYKNKTCEKCSSRLVMRSDDNPESIRNRFKAFNEETMPVINDYKERKLMIEVNGAQSIESVTRELFQKLDPIQKA